VKYAGQFSCVLSSVFDILDAFAEASIRVPSAVRDLPRVLCARVASCRRENDSLVSYTEELFLSLTRFPNLKRGSLFSFDRIPRFVPESEFGRRQGRCA
jgi:hypothetical protein